MRLMHSIKCFGTQEGLRFVSKPQIRDLRLVIKSDEIFPQSWPMMAQNRFQKPSKSVTSVFMTMNFVMFPVQTKKS